MRRFPSPLRVTRPPPSSTIFGFALTTLAVAVMVMVTGAAPHANVMIPPAATAATTASEVQLAGVPSPMTRVGALVSSGPASAGTAAPPSGFPGEGNGGGGGAGVVGCGVSATTGTGEGCGCEPHAVRPTSTAAATATSRALT